MVDYFVKQENRVVPVHFQFARKRGGQPEFIECKKPEIVPRPSLPTPPTAVHAKQPEASAALQATLPFSDPPADKPKEAFVWDESKGLNEDFLGPLHRTKIGILFVGGVMNPETIKAQIVNAEDQLRTAMLSSDVGSLDKLLAPELIFTNHLGHLLGKENDLAAHRLGTLKLKELKPSEQQIHLNGDVAIVSVRMQLSGTYDGNPVNGDFRFTRVWTLSSDKTWHVIAAHAGIVV